MSSVSELLSCVQEFINLNYCFCVLIVFSAILYFLKKESNNTLHAAVFDGKMVKSINLIQEHPEWINELHHLDGLSPFMRACHNGNTQLVRYMLKNGANVHLNSSNGESPFHLCICHYIDNRNDSSCLVLKLLLDAKCDINATNSKGITPLQLAAAFGVRSVCEWLMKNGAAISGNPNPYSLAKFQGHYKTAKTIKENMKKQLVY